MLPRAATDLIGLIGEEAAYSLMAARCGQTIEFPKGDIGRGEQSFTVLTDIVGQEAAKKLCAHYGGDRLYIPFCNKNELAKRNQTIVARYNDGKTVGELVRDYHLSDRQIRNILKLTDMSSALQMDMFAQ